MNRKLIHTALILFLALGTSELASALSVTSIVITSGAQTVPVGTCSVAVRVRSEDRYGNVVAVSSNTPVYFTGSSAALTFYSDSVCSASISRTVIHAGSSSTKFFFVGSYSGSQLIQLASYYNSGQQYELITTTPADPPPNPPPSGSIAGRAIPAPVYGLTLDDVSQPSAEVNSMRQLAHMPTARIVFDYSEPPSYYSGPIQQFRSVAYIMGQIADSSDMSRYTISTYQARAQNYVSGLGSQVDLWEVGNEVNGDWLGSNTLSKIETAYDAVSNAGGATAITFFYEGEPSDPYNCISTDNGGNDMFTWINQNFQLSLAPSSRSQETEKIRLGANYILVSWYPSQCNNLQPNWTTIFSKLSSIFPNSKLGFGEIGTANPQGGSQYEINLINQFYPLSRTTTLPASYIGGYFWWYYAEEMVPTTATTLFGVLNNAIQ